MLLLHVCAFDELVSMTAKTNLTSLLSGRGMLPSECDKRFLDVACRLERYGMDFHSIYVSLLSKVLVEDKNFNVLFLFTSLSSSPPLSFGPFLLLQDISGIRLWLGVTGRGITVFCGVEPNLTTLNNFPW